MDQVVSVLRTQCGERELLVVHDVSLPVVTHLDSPLPLDQGVGGVGGGADYEVIFSSGLDIAAIGIGDQGHLVIVRSSRTNDPTHLQPQVVLS